MYAAAGLLKAVSSGPDVAEYLIVPPVLWEADGLGPEDEVPDRPVVTADSQEPWAEVEEDDERNP